MIVIIELESLVDRGSIFLMRERRERLSEITAWESRFFAAIHQGG